MKKIILLLMLTCGMLSWASAQQSNKSDTIRPKKIHVPKRHQRLPPHKMMKMVDTTRKDTSAKP